MKAIFLSIVAICLIAISIVSWNAIPDLPNSYPWAPPNSFFDKFRYYGGYGAILTFWVGVIFILFAALELWKYLK